MITPRPTPLLALALTGTLLVACGGGGGDDDTVQSQQLETVYAPASFGDDDLELCYYVDSEDEVRQLQADGLCEDDWQPYPAPQPYLLAFYPYFISPAYSSVYIPPQRRETFKSDAEVFRRNNEAAITKASATAVYKGSDGKTYTGKQVASQPGSFGNGQKGFGNGAPKACALGIPDPADIPTIELVAYAAPPAPPRPAPAPPRVNTPSQPRSNSNPGKANTPPRQQQQPAKPRTGFGGRC